MNAHVERLTNLVVPPEDAGRRQDWDDVARELGLGLPADYRELIDTYGGGRFDAYLWLLEPRCPNRHYDLHRSVAERDEGFEMLWEDGEPKPVQLLESPGSRVIPWASTDNGEFLYWLAHPEIHPDDWTVMVNEARGAWWEHFDVGCAELLVRLLTGEVRSEILSSSFPLEVHEFRASRSF
ncbi:SMI1/KNR4 family protein [Streptomyces sp. TRM70350]|uniref:SMI1/KNR4 family protein n=1 Tax=Streptomyces sp. TRM70350 TaxID=2856165 RepID=UPI001C4388A7|nr:SMI1/KNR4 family protein [Streptomyces sp. TRM70350]MBV7699223.1 SMI1/KNR4 family protein [Streptomyces sp. TRM70350]